MPTVFYDPRDPKGRRIVAEDWRDARKAAKAAFRASRRKEAQEDGAHRGLNALRDPFSHAVGGSMQCPVEARPIARDLIASNAPSVRPREQPSRVVGDSVFDGAQPVVIRALPRAFVLSRKKGPSVGIRRGRNAYGEWRKGIERALASARVAAQRERNALQKSLALVFYDSKATRVPSPFLGSQIATIAPVGARASTGASVSRPVVSVASASRAMRREASDTDRNVAGSKLAAKRAATKAARK